MVEEEFELGIPLFTFAEHQEDASTSHNYPFAPGSTPSSGSDWTRLTRTGYDTYSSIPVASGLNGSYNNSWATKFISSTNTAPLYAQALTATTNLKGMATWTEAKVLGATNLYVYSVMLYDNDGRVIQVKTKNESGGQDVMTTQYNWRGIPLIKVEYTEKLESPVISSIITSKYEYDDLMRLTVLKKQVSITDNGQTVNNDEITILKNEYDAIGQLKKKSVGTAKNNTGAYTSNPIESLEFDYNVRSWLLGTNRKYLEELGNARFGFELSYDKRKSQVDGFVDDIYDNAQYNGNIGGMLWRSVGDGEKRKYEFEYDPVNRLTKAKFTEASSSWVENNSAKNYTVGGDPLTGGKIRYDDNGNILEMWQKGWKITGSDWIDKLAYTYDGSNRLEKVADGVTGAFNGKLGDFKDGTNTESIDYTYDVNGNLVRDYNKGIGNTSNDGILYNHLNLPQTITFRHSNGTVKGTISYWYSADGLKQRKTTVENDVSIEYNGNSYSTDITTVTQYIGASVFESKTYSNGTLQTNLGEAARLQLIGHEEGRIRLLKENASQPQLPTGIAFDYFLKDHLGNVRMVLTDQKKQDIYPAATLEGSATTGATSRLNHEHKYYKIENSLCRK
ncbi:MAG: hypothetical protein NVV59_20310 [Chitinophagaceae bacterium]|nr:hypothetical protein [Chitinophagaceae bacterium]